MNLWDMLTENHSYKLKRHDLKGVIVILDVYLPQRPMFWACSADVHNDVVSSMMSRNRFNEIMKYLDPNDKFSKAGPLLDKLNKQCLLNHLSEQTVSTDESMVPYFGRHECKQFMKNKPVNLDTNFGLLQLHSDMTFNFIFICVKTTSLIQIWGLEDLQLTSSWSVCQNMQDLVIREMRERGREKERERGRKREKEGEKGRERQRQGERERERKCTIKANKGHEKARKGINWCFNRW